MWDFTKGTEPERMQVKKATPPPTPKQPKPWDVPPPPTHGDPVDDLTFAAVGRALSHWERFERVLSILFAEFVGDQDDDLPAVRAYGAVATFRGRVEMIRAAAEAYFAAYPNPGGEKLLDDLLDEASNFSARRNEIAHGFVNGWRPEDSPDTPKGFVLMPFNYTPRKSKFDATATMQTRPPRPKLRPSYLYSAKEIDTFRSHFERLSTHAMNVSTGIRTLRRVNANRKLATRNPL